MQTFIKDYIKPALEYKQQSWQRL